MSQGLRGINISVLLFCVALSFMILGAGWFSWVGFVPEDGGFVDGGTDTGEQIDGEDPDITDSDGMLGDFGLVTGGMAILSILWTMIVETPSFLSALGATDEVAFAIGNLVRLSFLLAIAFFVRGFR